MNKKFSEALKEAFIGVKISKSKDYMSKDYTPKDYAPTYLINRFPIMASYGYLTAKIDGYNEELAKSLGIAIATYYAIMKRVGLSQYGRYLRKTKVRRTGESTADAIFFNSPDSFKEFEIVDFGNGSFIKRKKDNIILAIATIRGKQYPFTIKRFENEKEKLNWIRKNGFEFFSQKVIPAIKEEEKTIKRKLSEGHDFFRFWKENRDYWRTPEFWEV